MSLVSTSTIDSTTTTSATSSHTLSPTAPIPVPATAAASVFLPFTTASLATHANTASMMKKPLSFPLSPHYEASSTGTSTSSSASSSTTPSTCPSPLSISPSHDTSIGYAALSAARVAATVASFTGLTLVTRDSVSSTTSSCMEEILGDNRGKEREKVSRMSGSSDSLGETMSTSYEESSHKKVLVMRSRVVAGATPVMTPAVTGTTTVGSSTTMMSRSKPSMGFAEMMREYEEDGQDMNDDGDFGFGFIDFDD